MLVDAILQFLVKFGTIWTQFGPNLESGMILLDYIENHLQYLDKFFRTSLESGNRLYESKFDASIIHLSEIWTKFVTIWTKSGIWNDHFGLY